MYFPFLNTSHTPPPPLQIKLEKEKKEIEKQGIPWKYESQKNLQSRCNFGIFDLMEAADVRNMK